MGSTGCAASECPSWEVATRGPKKEKEATGSRELLLGSSPARKQPIVPRFDFDDPAFVPTQTRDLTPPSASEAVGGAV